MEMHREDVERKQRHTRYDISNELILTSPSGKSVKGMSLNFSEGGIMILSSNTKFQPGDRVFIELIGKFNYQLGFLNAEVVHERPGQEPQSQLSGVKFTHLTYLQKESLRQFINEIGH